MKIGKFQIFFSKYYWPQTHVPLKARKFLFMTIFWPACSTDVDKKQEFLTGTPLLEDGKVFRYYKVSQDIPKDGVVKE